MSLAAQSGGKDRLCPSRIFPPALYLQQAIKTFLKIHLRFAEICMSLFLSIILKYMFWFRITNLFELGIFLENWDMVNAKQTPLTNLIYDSDRKNLSKLQDSNHAKL